jgi:hypothetical protein
VFHLKYEELVDFVDLSGCFSGWSWWLNPPLPQEALKLFLHESAENNMTIIYLFSKHFKLSNSVGKNVFTVNRCKSTYGYA